MSWSKRLTLLVALPLIALLAGGCELRTGVAVTVGGDGSGDLMFTLAADEQLRRDARQAGADPLAALVEVAQQLPRWQVARSTEGQMQGVTLSTRFDDPDQLERLSTQFSEALAAPELRPLGPLRVIVDDETVELRGDASLDVAPAVVELGVRADRAQQVLAENVVLRVVARMPGEVLESNADTTRDNTVAWTIDAGQRRTLRVVAERPWTAARLARLLITTDGMLALMLGIALIFDWRRATHDRSPL